MARGCRGTVVRASKEEEEEEWRGLMVEEHGESGQRCELQLDRQHSGWIRHPVVAGAESGNWNNLQACYCTLWLLSGVFLWIFLVY